MDLSKKSIDYIIMLNAHEESRLAELLADYTQARPTIDPAEAHESLKNRVSVLLRAGRIGMYELPLRHASKPYRDLPLEEALAVVDQPDQWAWEPPSDATAFYPLFEIDEMNWGE